MRYWVVLWGIVFNLAASAASYPTEKEYLKYFASAIDEAEKITGHEVEVIPALRVISRAESEALLQEQINAHYAAQGLEAPEIAPAKHHGYLYYLNASNEVVVLYRQHKALLKRMAAAKVVGTPRKLTMVHLAHEIIHVFQEQTMNMEKYRDLSSELRKVLRSLMEGQALYYEFELAKAKRLKGYEEFRLAQVQGFSTSGAEDPLYATGYETVKQLMKIDGGAVWHVLEALSRRQHPDARYLAILETLISECQAARRGNSLTPLRQIAIRTHQLDAKQYQYLRGEMLNSYLRTLPESLQFKPSHILSAQRLAGDFRAVPLEPTAATSVTHLAFVSEKRAKDYQTQAVARSSCPAQLGRNRYILRSHAHVLLIEGEADWPSDTLFRTQQYLLKFTR